MKRLRDSCKYRVGKLDKDRCRNRVGKLEGLQGTLFPCVRSAIMKLKEKLWFAVKIRQP